MYISIHVGVRMMQKKTSPRIRKANMSKTCWKEDWKNEPRMDNGNENQENATRKGMKIVVRRLPKYTK